MGSLVQRKSNSAVKVLVVDDDSVGRRGTLLDGVAKTRRSRLKATHQSSDGL